MQIILQDVNAVRFFGDSLYDVFRKASAGGSAAAAAVETGEFLAKFLDLIQFFHTFFQIIRKFEYRNVFNLFIPVCIVRIGLCRMNRRYG